MAVEGDSVWLVNADDDTIARIDTGTNRVETHDVASEPGGWPSTPRRIDLADHPRDGTVRRIEPASGRTVATIPVGSPAYGMTTDDRGIWIALPDEGPHRIDRRPTLSL
jgi:DNA-binding beta-propeller fold protein YncE